MRRRIPEQPDLFGAVRPAIELSTAQRSKAVQLLQALLKEALLITALGSNVETQEAGDDEDHA